MTATSQCLLLYIEKYSESYDNEGFAPQYFEEECDNVCDGKFKSEQNACG
jgi:hypothetical protein